MFFALGFGAEALRAELSVPDALAKTLSLYLIGGGLSGVRNNVVIICICGPSASWR